MSSDLDMIYAKKSSPIQNQKEKSQEILTSKQKSKKVSKQASLQESKQATRDITFEERLLSLLQTATTDLKPNTFRYTQEELDFIRDVSYEAQVKYNTKFDKNDVARTGIEWLMNDWKEKKNTSLLARILTSKQIRKQ